MKKLLCIGLCTAVSSLAMAQTTTNVFNTMDANTTTSGYVFRVSASSFTNGKKKLEAVPITSILSAGTGINITAGGVISSTITQADGSETKVSAGTGISISGTGTTASPYILSSTVSADGSETKVSAGTGISISGTGTTASPYTITAADVSSTNEIQALSLSGSTLSLSLGGGSVVLPTPDGSETKVSAGTGISISGIGTTASPYVITNSVTLPKRWVYKTHSKAVSTATLTIPAGAPTALTEIQVYIGGVKMTPSSDNYTVSGTTLTFVLGAPNADVEILYWE